MPANPRSTPEHLSGLVWIKSFLADNSRLYGFFTIDEKLLFESPRHEPPVSSLAILDPQYEVAVTGILEYQRPHVTPFSENGWKTIFTSPYRLAVVDLSDVRVRAGLSITKQTMAGMNQICKDNDIHFLAVLLPTKEINIPQEKE